MSINPLNDISRVYLEQIAAVEEGVRPGNVETPLDKTAFKKRRRSLAGKEKSAEAIGRGHKGKEWYNSGRTYSPDEAKRMRSKLDDAERRTRHRSAVDPDSEDDSSFSASKTKNPKKLRKQKAMGEIGEAKEKPKFWWNDDGDDKGYEKGEVSGKFKKKVNKEGYSNWREELSEVMEVINKDKAEKITEKNVNNKIAINPNMGEAVENLGGTLIEMVEIDEVDYIVDSVYGELLDEGYEEDDIEEALEYALTEAKVTFGHDTDKPYQHQKKSGAGQLIKAVGRLARQKLSSKVGSVKKSARAAVVRGARKVARGALGVARKIEGEDNKVNPRSKGAKPTSAPKRPPSAAGTRERVSSGTYQAPSTSKKKPEKPSDPWGSATVPQKPKPKPKPEKPSDPWGSATVPQKPKPKAEKPAAPKATAKPKPAATKPVAPKAKTKTAKVSGGTAKPPAKKKKSKLDTLLADIRSESVSNEPKLKPGSGLGGGAPVYPKGKEPKPTGAKLPLQKAHYELDGNLLDEKTLTVAERRKKEEIFKSLKRKRQDFESRYPGRSEDIMHGVATKIAKKLV